MRLSSLALALLLTATAHAQTSTATYRVTLGTTWSAQTHPDGFPPDPHFSPLVGAVHNANARLWEAGGIATDGIEDMAETGRTSTLVSEVTALISAGHAREAITGGAIPLSPGDASLTLDVTTDHPLVTLVTMLAPSPDWFVGTESLDLRDGDGWKPQVEVPMFVWDAGTDSGPTYTSANQNTSPAEAIARIEVSPFLVGGTLTPIGTMTFELQSVTDTEAGPETGLRLDVAPNPVQGTARVSVQNARPGSHLTLLDATGRTIMQVTTVREVTEVDTAGLAPGVYVLRLMAGDEVMTRPLVVAR